MFPQSVIEKITRFAAFQGDEISSFVRPTLDGISGGFCFITRSQEDNSPEMHPERLIGHCIVRPNDPIQYFIQNMQIKPIYLSICYMAQRWIQPFEHCSLASLHSNIQIPGIIHGFYKNKIHTLRHAEPQQFVRIFRSWFTGKYFKIRNV